MALRHLFSAAATILLLVHSAATAAVGHRNPKADGLFVFGSSLVDNGNNNFLPNTTAKANYFPYGIDSALGPSGRFSNGKNTIDALGELLGLRGPIPPFLDPRTNGHSIVHGVDFASGGSGILNETGSIGGKVLSLEEQIGYFEKTTLPELKKVLGCRGRRKDGRHPSVDLSKYIFVVETGGNDYLLNYYYKQNKGRGSTDLEKFTKDLIIKLYAHLKRLHKLGARKFMVMSVQAIGCVPVVKAKQHLLNSNRCVEAVNDGALLFNAQLRSLVDVANAHLHASHMIYLNSYDVISDLIHTPAPKGFTETKKACCEVNWTNGILCREGGGTCGDREGHVFFDGLHPTEAVNTWVAKRAYQSEHHRDVYPINIKQLAEI